MAAADTMQQVRRWRRMRHAAGRREAAAQPLNIIQKTYRAEALARLQRAVLADCGFTERLVAFWSNHSAFPPTRRAGADVAGRSSARRSARMCSAASPTC